MGDIRHALPGDLDVLTTIEAASYPPAEGASKKSIRERLAHFSDCFWLLENEEREIVAFINGMLTNKTDLTDEMYDHPELHRENGRWLMIFSVVTHPRYRGQGYASRGMERVIEDMRGQKRSGIVLTCKEGLLPFYARFGFVNEGISASTHGDVTWYQVRLTF